MLKKILIGLVLWIMISLTVLWIFAFGAPPPEPLIQKIADLPVLQDGICVEKATQVEFYCQIRGRDGEYYLIMFDLNTKQPVKIFYQKGSDHNDSQKIWEDAWIES